MTTYTTPHNLPQLETTDLIKSPTGDNLRKQINALSAASNTALDAVKWDKGVNAADLNTIQSSGRWAVNSTTTANLPVAVAGTVHINWGSTTGTQTYVTREATPRVYHRAYLAGAWGAWTSVLIDAKAYTDQRDEDYRTVDRALWRQEDDEHQAAAELNAANDATTKANTAKTDAIADATTKYGGLPARVTTLEGAKYMPEWKASTAYTAGQRVIAPNGDVVSAKVAFTSGATYSAANWNASAQDGRIAEVETDVARLAIPALNDWFVALSKWATSPAQVVVIGDSISEGADAGTITNRWVNRVQKYLTEAYGAPDGAKFPFIPVLPATSGATDWPVTRTDPGGTISADINWGLGWRAAKLYAGALVSFTFTGTSAAVMYTKASGVGIMRVVVDGGTPVLIDTNSVTNGPTSDSATWNTGPLTAGSHTVDVSFDTSTTGGITNVLVQGLLTWNGDETSGIRVIDAAHSGYRSANFTTTTTRTASNAVKAAGGAQLAVIAIGTNDTLYPADFPNYRANVERMISALRTTAGFTGSVLLIHWYMTNQMTEAQWAPYGEILADIAAADPKVAYLDMRRRMPDMPTPYTGPEGLGFYAGNVHPNARGYKFIADEVTDYVTNGR